MTIDPERDRWRTTFYSTSGHEVGLPFSPFTWQGPPLLLFQLEMNA